MKKHMSTIAIGCLALVTGCMTLDEQLNSPDPAVRTAAEKRLEGIAVDSNEWNGGASRLERIAAIARINNQDSLMRILMTDFEDGRFNGAELCEMFHTDVDVYGPCIDRLDQEHLIEFILFESTNPFYQDKRTRAYMKSNRNSKFRNRSESDDILCENPETYSAEMLLASGCEYGKFARNKDAQKSYSRMIYAIAKLSDADSIVKCFSKATTFELKEALFPYVFKNWQSVQNKYDLAALLKVYIQMVRDVSRRRKMLEEKRAEYEDTKKAIVAKIADQGVYALMLDKASKFYIDDTVVTFAIVDRMDKDTAYSFAMKELKGKDFRSWDRDYMPTIQLAKAVYCKVDDDARKTALTDLMVAKIKAYKNKEGTRLGYKTVEKQVREAIDFWGDVLPESARSSLNVKRTLD